MPEAHQIKASAEPPFNPYFALISGVIAVSTGAIFARLADAPALVIAAYRVGLATAVIAPLALSKAGAELRRLSFKDFRLAAISGLFLALHFATWISSLDYTSVANSVVLVNTNPLWVGIFTPFITKERIKPAVAAGILISVTGGVIIGIGDFATGSQALSVAVYLLLGRNLRRKLSLLAYIFVCYGSAALVLWLIVLILQLPVSGFSMNTWTCLWAMALITHLIGHSSYNWALKWFSAGLIAISLLGEPIGSTVLAYFILNEGLSWSKLIGGGLILSAIYISARYEKNRS
jgi:drug/metabolite transporter (DMT)-like permease